jgi:hypothetical protein
VVLIQDHRSIISYLFFIEIYIRRYPVGMSISERKLSLAEIGERTGIRPSASSGRKRKLVSGFVATISLPWIQAAAELSGKSLHVALAVWYYHHLEKASTVAMTRAKLRRFGVHRHGTSAALKRLEAAGLVTVRRSHGKAPRVSICGLKSENQ